jgi:hypothetical protein
MPRTRVRRRQAGEFVSLTLTLSRSQVEILDGLVACLRVGRQEVLQRGLFILDAAHLINSAPEDAKICVGVVVPGQPSLPV